MPSTDKMLADLAKRGWAVTLWNEAGKDWQATVSKGDHGDGTYDAWEDSYELNGPEATARDAVYTVWYEVVGCQLARMAEAAS